jgi:hypothetical protein
VTAEEIARADVRRRWNGYPDLAKEILQAMSDGWTLWIGGGYPYLQCPCEDQKKRLKLPKSPGRGGASAARRVHDQVKKCPKRHDLL